MVGRSRSLMRRRHAIYDYQPKSDQTSPTRPSLQELSRVRSRLLRFILESQRERETLEQRGFSSRLRDEHDH